ARRQRRGRSRQSASARQGAGDQRLRRRHGGVRIACDRALSDRQVPDRRHRADRGRRRARRLPFVARLLHRRARACVHVQVHERRSAGRNGRLGRGREGNALRDPDLVERPLYPGREILRRRHPLRHDLCDVRRFADDAKIRGHRRLCKARLGPPRLCARPGEGGRLMITLYHAPRSRSSGIVWLLEELGVPYKIEIVPIVYGNGQGTPAPESYRAIHPHKKVPAIDDDGKIVFECAAVAQYLCDAYPQAGLAPPIGDPARGTYDTLLAYWAGVMNPIATARFRGWDKDGPTGFGTFEDMEAFMNAKVAAAKPWMLGE